MICNAFIYCAGSNQKRTMYKVVLSYHLVRVKTHLKFFKKESFLLDSALSWACASK